MTNRSMGISVLGYGLSIAYGLGFIFYITGVVISSFAPEVIVNSPIYFERFRSIFEFRFYALFVSFLIYLPQFIGYLVLLGLSEKSRRFIIFMNWAMCFVFVVRMFFIQTIAPLVLLSVCFPIFIIFFLRQPKIAKQFHHLEIKYVGKTILVVDDDRGFLKMMGAILLSRGYRTWTATTGEAGLRLAKARKPDLILLDVILPGMKGRQICTLLKVDPVTKDIPVIFLTAKDSLDDIQAEMRAGAISHLTKPFDPHKLLDEVQRVLGV